LGGVLYVVLVVIGFGIASSFMGDFEARPADMLARFESHRPSAMFWTGVGLELLGLLLLLAFGVRIAVAVYRRGGELWLPVAAGALIALTAAVKVGSIGLALEAYLRPQRLGAQVVAGLIGSDDVIDSLTTGALATFMLVLGVAALASVASARWLGWSAVAAGVGTMAAAAGFDPGQLLGLAWFVAAAWWLTRHGSARRPDSVPGVPETVSRESDPQPARRS
jgi:hypothetical protein